MPIYIFCKDVTNRELIEVDAPDMEKARKLLEMNAGFVTAKQVVRTEIVCIGGRDKEEIKAKESRP